jgi:hypothetical protein
MISAMLPILALCVIASAGAAAPVQEAPKPPNAAAIHEVVREYLAARERGDAAALGALFTADVDQLTSSGEWRRGREDVVRGAIRLTK